MPSGRAPCGGVMCPNCRVEMLYYPSLPAADGTGRATRKRQGSGTRCGRGIHGAKWHGKHLMVRWTDSEASEGPECISPASISTEAQSQPRCTEADLNEHQGHCCFIRQNKALKCCLNAAERLQHRSFRSKNLIDFNILYVCSFWFIRQNLSTDVFGYNGFNSNTVTVNKIPLLKLQMQC